LTWPNLAIRKYLRKLYKNINLIEPLTPTPHTLVLKSSAIENWSTERNGNYPALDNFISQLGSPNQVTSRVFLKFKNNFDYNLILIIIVIIVKKHAIIMSGTINVNHTKT